MGRQEIVTYECDWCAATSPAKGASSRTDMPDGWGYGRSTGDDVLCAECQRALNAAIVSAKASRKAGIPIGRTHR